MIRVSAELYNLIEEQLKSTHSKYGSNFKLRTEAITVTTVTREARKFYPEEG